MSGKRKPSPESTLLLPMPNASPLASSVSTYQFYSDEDKTGSTGNGGINSLKLNQQKNKELTKPAKILQTPQKQKVLLSTGSKTLDSVPPLLEANTSSFSSSSFSFDYDSVHSPGAASNASSEGPTYVRTPGFEHHAQEVEIQRKRQQYSKSRASLASQVEEQVDIHEPDVASGNENIRSSSKASHNGSLANITTKKKKSLGLGTSGNKSQAEIARKAEPSQQVTSKHKPKKGMRSTSPPEDGLHPRREVSVANTDLLFSLFRGIEEEQPKMTVVRRGRPKKPPSTMLTRVLRDEDPCLVSTVTESILPLIPDRTGSGSHAARLAQGQQVLAMVSLKDGDKSVSLPSLNVEHNYSQILSELVIKL